MWISSVLIEVILVFEILTILYSSVTIIVLKIYEKNELSQCHNKRTQLFTLIIPNCT